MKKIVSLMLALLVLSTVLCACGKETADSIVCNNSTIVAIPTKVETVEDKLIGTWKNIAAGASINEIILFEDGTCKMNFDSQLYDWVIVNGDELKIWNGPNVFVWEFDISGNTLTIYKKSGDINTYERIE